MKNAFKYIFLIIGLLCFVNSNFSQKRHKQKSKKVAVKKNLKKGNKKGSKKTSAKYRNAEKQGNVANLNTLLDKTSADVKSNKSDSIPEKVVTILSEFKPQLKNVAKIGFINASVQNDTASIYVEYQVPSQNLTFQYRPISLVPRGYKPDSIVQHNMGFNLKVGFGNYLHRYINLNLVTKDASNNTHSLGINNESVTGLHHLQNNNDLGFNYIGNISINKRNQLQTQAFYKQSSRFRYGLVPDSVTFPTSNYTQNFHHSGIAIAWINENLKQKSMQFNPSVHFEHFEGLSAATNNWVGFNSPMYVQIKNNIILNFDLSYNYNNYNSKLSPAQANTVLKFDPSIRFNKFNSIIKLGVSPTFKKEEFNLYPIVEFSKQLTDTNYLLIAGWNTQVINNSYASIVGKNPWITVPTKMEMTTKEQKFVAVQINAGKRMDYGVSISLNDYTNLPLFNKLMGTNRAEFGLLYSPLFERKASTIELEAHLRYQFSDKLLVNNNFKYLQFNSLLENAKPWGVLPLELTSKINWIPGNKWNLEGGIKYWTGAVIFSENSIPMDAKNALDISAAINYKLSPKWNAWIKGDNLLDRPYERWSDYPSLGVQLMAGVVYSFRK